MISPYAILLAPHEGVSLGASTRKNIHLGNQLPERTRGRPWGRLRVRIRSIEKNVKLEVLSCCTRFHEPHVVSEYAFF